MSTITPSIPEHGSRCTEVLSDTLRGYKGIQDAGYDLEKGRLQIHYDPRLLTREQALLIIKTAGKKATARVLQCRLKGPEACAACAASLSDELVSHYKQLGSGSLPATHFEAAGGTGAIEVRLNQPAAIGSDAAIVDETFRGPEAAQPERVGLPRQRVEIILTVLTALFAGLATFLSKAAVPPALITVFYGLAFAAGGYYGLLDGVETLKEKRLDVNLLMILAAVGAAVIGQPLEGAVLLFLFSLSNTLQSYAMDRSRKAIEKLLDLRPPVATVRRGSRLIALPVEKLVVGDLVVVRPGERFPIDGEVVTGNSDVNQASITGESMPVHKQPGDAVFAGTVNGNGSLEIRTARLAKDTTLARIVQMVEEAQANKAQTQRMLDNFEQVYALFVLGGAALLILLPTLALDQAFYPAFYRAMTWLVVASPCALVISTPASILSAIANGARNGVLFKGGAHLERAATLKVVAFDKTGTLTTGKPRLAALKPVNGLEDRELLRLAATVEARSEHPLATALVKEAHERKIELPICTDFRAIPGQGVEGRVDMLPVWIGGRRFFFERGVEIPAGMLAEMERLEDEGQTVMLVYSPARGWLGSFGAADTVRPDAAGMVTRLKQAGVERVVMLTGDNERVAARVVAQTGVDEFHASLLPQDKVRMIQRLREKYGPVAMVGDGVNDAPALASADVGIAMGGAGTDVAMETADVVLMSEDLQKLPHTVGLARQARRIVWQNLVFALAVIVLLVVSAFGASLPLPLGVVGHEGSTVLVVLNGLLLLAYKT